MLTAAGQLRSTNQKAAIALPFKVRQWADLAGRGSWQDLSMKNGLVYRGR